MMSDKNQPANLTILPAGDSAALAQQLRAKEITAGHFTNGIYAAKSELVVPTVLAGFQYATDTETKAAKPPALIIAINSDASMLAINAQRTAQLETEIAAGRKTVEDRAKLQAEIARQEDQQARALKVAVPLAQQHPTRPVVVMFYDQDTPNKLYGGLKAAGFGMESLLKWGYGTKPQEGRIEGAEYFKRTLGFPLPNDIAPICATITPVGGQKGTVTVVDLREGALNYISRTNKVMFTVAHPELLQYAVGSRSAPAAGPQHDAKPK